MLGRTANGLYWSYRYLERAENTARLIETGLRMALTRASMSEAEWGSLLDTIGARTAYLARHGEVSRAGVVDWLLRDPDNPDAVMNTMRAARQDARMVRTALTPEVWEALNGAYMDLKGILARKVAERDLPKVLDRVRHHAAQIRGATLGTMLRNDIFNFIRLGLFLERGDFTARLLDVKYYVLLPTAAPVGSSLDNAQWETILRASSAIGGFRMVHASQTGPRGIVDFLMLDPRMPRSLAFCATKIEANLGYLAQDYGQQSPAFEQARALRARLARDNVEAIFEFGLHEYLLERIGETAAIGRQIETDFCFHDWGAGAPCD